jgi:hypothetical protein
MKKTLIILILIVITALALVSCEKEVVSYCPFCGHSGIEEVSVYDKDTGVTKIYYQCTYEKCGKKFGAGQL